MTMENIRLVIGIFLLILAAIVHFIHTTLEQQILRREIESVGLMAIPIAVSGVGLPFLAAYLIVGTKNLVIFAIYGFGFLLVTSSSAFLAKSVFDFLKKPVIIGKPKNGGKAKTYIYTVTQLILMAILFYVMWISYKIIFGG